MKDSKMICSCWAAARTLRQLPQLSSCTGTCNGMAKPGSVGALQSPEPFKANCPLGMSLSQGTRARYRSRRDDHRTLCCTFSGQAECALLRLVPWETEERGPSSRRSVQPGARAVTARGVVTAPRFWSLCPLTRHLHPFLLPAATHAAGFPLWK